MLRNNIIIMMKYEKCMLSVYIFTEAFSKQSQTPLLTYVCNQLVTNRYLFKY